MAETAQEIRHLTREELEDGLEHIRQSPKDEGRVELIVRRPQPGQRESLSQGTLDLQEGLMGDCWKERGSSSTADGSANRDAQLTIMNVRVADLVAQDPTRRPLAGDQLYIDLDLSVENLPPGTRLEIGSTVVEVSALPHNGCQQFVARFGLDAMKFVNSSMGKQLHLRGINAKVVQGGVVRVGDVARKI